ncbi:hypothetical protein C8Q79DRAFT_999177 [Trametes meyenii]|nr:hypothetical protein C8Q79DRAFT_999177 [Trametes meyenii]
MSGRKEAALVAFLVLAAVEECRSAEQYTAVPRWGQAAALVDDMLFIQGGRTDQYNSYGYSSAPVNNDILLLPLNTNFNISSPPWQYLAGCDNCSSTQGPAVAWHTLSAFNTTDLLLFGGDAGPNGPIADPEKADSAALLNVANRASPVWTLESQSWANEPLRRIYHSASSTGGKIWLTGGEKADGSGNAFSDHYIYDPTSPSFTQLPTTNGPPDILGHTSLILPDRRLIVFGGYSPSQSALLPFSTVWSLDTTQSSLSWTTLSVSTANLPSPRRGFASAVLDDGKVIIQGGADAEMQNVFDDGWVLDTTQSPMAWSSLAALSELGPRRDHFAVALGSEVLFGFGAYNPVSLPSSRPYLTSPRLRSIRACQCEPASVRYIEGGVPQRVHAPGCRTAGGPSGTRGGSSPSGGNAGDGPVTGPAGGSSKSHATAVALGGAAACFRLLNSSDDTDNPHNGTILPGRPVVQTVREKLGGLVPGRNTRQPRRRDMLAEEDTRVYDEPGCIGSWSTGHGRPTLGDVVQDSLTSLRNVGGAMLAYASGTRSSKNREPSGASSTTYWEKDLSYEPYSDKTALVGLPNIPQNSYTSQWSYYEDPFADYEIESFKMPADDEYDSDPTELNAPPSLDDPPPRPYTYGRVVPGTVDVTRLSPLSEKPSDSSHAYSSPLNTSSSADQLRIPGDPPRSPRRPSSIIDANPPIMTTMRRSDSWWSRFAKTPILDRLSTTDSSRAQRPLDFRDPNPPPQSSNSLSPDEPPSQRGSRHDPMYASAHHGRSASSLQTSKTADSEVIERMGRTMDIVQKGTVSSHASTASTDSGTTVDAYGVSRPSPSSSATGEHALGALAVAIPARADPDPGTLNLVQSPTEMSATEAVASSAARYGGGETRRPSPPRGTSVAARVAALEQHSRTPPLPPLPPSRTKKARSSVYGLAPKPSLFVANPDRRTGSGDS